MNRTTLCLAAKRFLPAKVGSRRITVTCRLLFMELIEHTRNNAVCWPSMRYLADRIGTTPRTLQNHLGLLGQIGVVRVESRPGQSSLYTVSREVMDFVRTFSAATYEKFSGTYENSSPRILNKVKNQDSPLPPAPAAAKSTPPVQASGRGGAFSTSPSQNQKRIAAFHELWAAYPLKQGHDVALRLFLSLDHARRLPAMETLLAAIAAMKEHDSRWQRGKIPLLHRWLREGRWLDQPFSEQIKSPSGSLSVAVEAPSDPRIASLQKQIAKLTSASPVTNHSILDPKFNELWDSWGLKQARSAALNYWVGLSEASKERVFNDAIDFIKSQPVSWPLFPTWLRQNA